MVFYGMYDLCGLVWFSIVYANAFPCKVTNGLNRICMVLYGLAHLCTIGTSVWRSGG